MAVNTFLSNLTNSIINFTEESQANTLNLPVFKSDKRTLVIGDIHGMYDKLVSALSNANATEDDRLIFLGDYTDRGNGNLNCMKFIINASKCKNVHLLMGNHEIMLYEYFTYASYTVMNKYVPIEHLMDSEFDKIVYTMQEGKLSNNYLINGGQVTLDEIDESSFDIFKEYLSIIADLKFIVIDKKENQKYLFVHAGINVNNTLDNQSIQDVVWIREKFYDNYNGKTIVVIGHTPTLYTFKDNVPHFKSNILFADTGSFTQFGKISVIDIFNNCYWQNS